MQRAPLAPERSSSAEALRARFGVRHDPRPRFALGTDGHVERYWQLLGIINGWPPIPTMVPAFEWTIATLPAHPGRG